MTNKLREEFDTQKIVEEIMLKRAETIDLFCKTFIVTEIKNYDHFKTGSLELVEQQTDGPMSVGRTYRCQFVPYDELEKKKKRLVKQKAIQELLSQARQEALREAVEAASGHAGGCLEYYCCGSRVIDAIESLLTKPKDK